jgi:hypothetical protein
VSTSHDKAAVDEYQALEILKIIVLIVKKAKKFTEHPYEGRKNFHAFCHLIKQIYLLREQCFFLQCALCPEKPVLGWHFPGLMKALYLYYHVYFILYFFQNKVHK